MERGIWFENRSLAHFATDMSLGLERFPVILDLRPMEDCRAHLLQHTRRSPLPLPSVAPGPSDIVSDEGSYGSSLTLTTSSPQSSDEGNVPDVTESSVRGPFRTRSRIMSEMFCSLASTPFEASSALRGRSSNSQTTQTTFKYPVR